MKHIYYMILVIVSSCAQNGKEAKTNSNQTIEKIENSKDSISIQELKLLTKVEAIHKYGIPSSIEQFTLHDAHGEFRNTITNKYSQKERQNESIVIDELTWEKDQETWITVWYEVQQKKSVPKEIYIWNKGDEF
ncbi:hypothetical protein [Aquimarina megaterium]|uniref:hypothetical protein n=1 Tax=Aquimarina megaterium TaxID=1443666 RepID=UPI001267CF6B|nr:hypothetical protein [Aquimarina megaterium]